MKKIYSLFAAALMFGFTACEDVPAPYGVNDDPVTPEQPEEVKTPPYSEAFSSTLGAFQSVLTSGKGAWIIDYSTAKAAGYDNATQTTTPGTYYLVSPEIDLAGLAEAHVVYEYILRYNAGEENQQLLITDSYDAEAPTEGWTLMSQTHTEGTDWTNFSKADLAVPAEFLGKKVRIAFRYNCGESGSTWEVKNFSIAAGKPDDPQPEEVKTPPYSETFSSTLGAFQNVLTSGAGAWIIDYGTAKAAGYDNATKVTTPGTYYLVSPEIDLAGLAEAHVAYEYILRYNAGDENQQLLITDSYDAEAPTEGWTLMSQTHTEGTDWTNFSKADLAVPAEFLGKKVRIAFRYNCGESGSTWEVKNFSIAAGKPGEGGGEGGGEDVGDPTSSNGDFEAWTDGAPVNWKSTTSASKGAITMSTDAHSGEYAAEVAGTTSGNNRLAYKELTLQPGTYTMTFFVKAATANGGSVRPGYVPVVDGAAVGSKYTYGDYTNNLTNTEWVQVTHTFELTEETTVNPVVMVSKNPGGNVLFDDFTLTDDKGTEYIK